MSDDDNSAGGAQEADDERRVRAAIVAVHRDCTLSGVEKQRRVRALLRGVATDTADQAATPCCANNDNDDDDDDRAPTGASFYSGADAHSQTAVFGCAHFKRDVYLLAPCCNRWYVCRLCHDDCEDHAMDRRNIARQRCMHCMQTTPVGAQCTSAACGGRLLAHYYCAICHCHRKETDLHFWHCERCGLCRVGAVGTEYRHCDTCNLCCPVDADGAPRHRCMAASSDAQACPVCAHGIHASPTPVAALRCGHAMHFECLESMLARGADDVRTFRCPLCKQSIDDMRAVWAQMDSAIAATTMPEPERSWTVHIGCNDCRAETLDAPYHYYGLKCAAAGCGSYNTYVVEVHK